MEAKTILRQLPRYRRDCCSSKLEEQRVIKFLLADGLDLDRLKSMYPGLLEQPMNGQNSNALMEGMKHPNKAMQLPPDQWSNPSKHVKL